MVMEYQKEHQLLAQYAQVSNRKILSSLSELDEGDVPMLEMLEWCRSQFHVVVMKSGAILSSRPSSRLVQNCKIVMFNKGLVPGPVYPATSELMQMLLAGGEGVDHYAGSDQQSTSTQQQRLRLLVKEALAVNASDIHIEVRQDIARIRFRRHGELMLHAEWLTQLAREVCSVAFNKETDHAITHFNPMVPQDASMPLTIDNQLLRLRLASLPAHGGFDVVMRILANADNHIATLKELGYLPEQEALIRRAISMPHGAVVMAGPTGSGKTTTLASCLALLGNDRKLYTIEDPVEKMIGNATQVPVNTKHYDRSFASMTRTALRMDPDVVMLGEMRDEDTAAVMVRAAITGHLVLSTVHTNTATDIVTRLADFGVSHSLLASPNLLVCLICQRLVPTLCQACAVPMAQSVRHRMHASRWRDALGERLGQVKVRSQQGCEQCSHQGIQGRTVVAEVAWIDESSRAYILKGDVLGWQQYLNQQGFVRLEERLIDKVCAGLVDPLDAEKFIGYLDADAGRQPYDYRHAKTGADLCLIA